jgi:hypothetical protein
MNETEMMQLSRLLNSLVGEPPNQVTPGAVHRKVLLRRVMKGVTATAAVAISASAGFAISAHAVGQRPVVTASPHASEPRYYFDEVTRPRSEQLRGLVRSTATGAVTARLNCPGPDPYLSAVATAGHETFFMACLQTVRQGTDRALTGTRIYRFALTRSGRVSEFRLLTGGNLSGLRGAALAASPDGAELAVGVAPVKSGALTDVLVINTRTGARTVWHAGHLPGGLRFNVQDLSFASLGRMLAVFGWGRCPKTAAARACKSPGQEMVVVSHASRGGQLASGRVIFTLPKLTPDRHAWVNDAFIRPDGLTALAVVSGTTGSVVQVSVATGKPSGILYQVQGNLLIRPDPSGRFVMIDGRGQVGQIFGWIHRGKLIPLKPAGQNVYLADW